MELSRDAEARSDESEENTISLMISVCSENCMLLPNCGAESLSAESVVIVCSEVTIEVGLRIREIVIKIRHWTTAGKAPFV